MRLFEIDQSYSVKIDPIAYTLLPFKRIWDRDKSKYKDRAKAELAYIYFMNDYKSDFYNEPVREEREKHVIKHLFKEVEWKPDTAVLEAQAFYQDSQETVSSKLLEGAMIYASKIDNFFREVDLEKRDSHGKLAFSPKMGNDILKDLGKTVQSLKQLQDVVRQEQDAGNHLRGGRTKSMYADGD